MKDWLVYGIGFLAQLMFSSRLIIQWLRSEKAKEVKTPTIFWKLSLLGAIFFFHLRIFKRRYCNNDRSGFDLFCLLQKSTIKRALERF